MIEIKAPYTTELQTYKKIFLAGSIEMGKAEPWQDQLVRELKNEKVILMNPRRDDWDSSWIQDPTPGTQFHEQVTWELDNIEKADLVIFYFDPKTQSPITLLELGMCLGKKKNILICCPDGYFRKGNIVISAKRNGYEVLNSIADLIEIIKEKLKENLNVKL